jgi:transcriptional regulator with XRE-family HTH domain
MEIGEEKPTFSSRLKEKRIEKGWSQHYLAARAGCTNSNISYLESHPKQKPKPETVESLATALGWPINEARRLAGYPESDDNLSPLEVEDDFRLSLYGYKELSEQGKGLVKKQIGQIIDFVSECEQGAGGQRAGLSFEEQAAQSAGRDMPEITLNELEKRIGKKKGKNK